MLLVFQGHPSNFKVTRDKKTLILTQIGRLLELKFEFTHGYEMQHKAWSNIEEVPYYFSRSTAKFQGHTGQKIANFYPNWMFLDVNFSLNSLVMAMKWCTKLEAT